MTHFAFKVLPERSPARAEGEFEKSKRTIMGNPIGDIVARTRRFGRDHVKENKEIERRWI
jgi:hypothetical protein